MLQFTFVAVIMTVAAFFTACVAEREEPSADVARNYIEPEFPEKCSVQLYKGGIYFFALGEIGYVTFRCERGKTCGLADNSDVRHHWRGGDQSVLIPDGDYNGASPRTASGDWISVDPCEFSGGAWLQDDGYGAYIAFEPEPEPDPMPVPGEAECEVWLEAGGLWLSGFEDLGSVMLRCERGEVCGLLEVPVYYSSEGEGFFVSVTDGRYNGASPISTSGEWLNVSECAFFGSAWLQDDGAGHYIAFEEVPEPEPDPDPGPSEAECVVYVGYYWSHWLESFHLRVCSSTDNFGSVVLRCERGRICELNEEPASIYDGSHWGYDGGVCFEHYFDPRVYNGASVISPSGEWLDLSRCSFCTPTWWQETDPGGYIAFDGGHMIGSPGGYYSGPECS
jgi:hypothetical protein